MSWLDDVDWRKEAIDHVGHAALGMLWCLPWVPVMLGGAWWLVFPAMAQAGVGGWIRERFQMHRQADDTMGSKRWVDVAAHVPGGLLLAGLCVAFG